MDPNDRVERVIIHFSPHPDDEVVGAPAMLMGYRDAGWTVVNVACSLGRRDDADRRRGELEEACRRARFESIIPDELPGISHLDDLGHAQSRLTELVTDVLASRHGGYVVSPSPHDGHHGHELVGRAVRDALEHASLPVRWAMWGLWSDLPLPNLYVPFEPDRLSEILFALQAHAGEIERNDYPALVESRARMNAMLGAERVFGFGAPRRRGPFAELLMEVVHTERGWRMPSPRMFDGPIEPARGGDSPIGWWLHRQSDRSRWRGDSAAGR